MAGDELSTGTLLVPVVVGLGRVFPEGMVVGESSVMEDGAAEGLTPPLVTSMVSFIPPLQCPMIPHMK